MNAVASLALRGQAQTVAQSLPAIDQFTNVRKEGVDKALREAIEEAINEIGKRMLNAENIK